MTQLPSDTPALFKGRHFDRLLIIQSVRWYIAYKLSYRDVCSLMAERGITLVHTTIMRWVIHYVPVCEKRWQKYARPTGSSWRVDETYIRVKGKWTYLYLFCLLLLPTPPTDGPGGPKSITTGSLHLALIDCRLRLSEVYDRVAFPIIESPVAEN